MFCNIVLSCVWYVVLVAVRFGVVLSLALYIMCVLVCVDVVCWFVLLWFGV